MQVCVDVAFSVWHSSTIYIVIYYIKIATIGNFIWRYIPIYDGMNQTMIKRNENRQVVSYGVLAIGRIY